MTLEPNAPPGEPVAMRNGLAMYAAGAGEPLLLMPYPHGFGLPFADWPLANLFQQLGRRVVTFDPPGAFRSTRPAQMTMSEMLDCAEQTLTSLRSSFKSFLDSGGSAVLMFVSVQFLQLES